MSRLFELSGFQNNPIKIVNSPNSPSLLKQISNIKLNEKYIVVNDDTVSGNTFNKIKRIIIVCKY